MGLLWKIFYHAFLKKPKRYRDYRGYTNDFENAQTNKEKGDKYELQILRHYKKQGYKVYPQGFIKGKADGGIDLVAYKGSEALLIQCKNWEYKQVKQEHLRIFMGDCAAYLEKNQKIFAKKNVRRVFITSCENLDYGVKKFLEENDVEYKIITYIL
ncbi:restriction endonuclease [Helicobacter pullorum]|uniref:restriction endonuclease n=1 Tax=Helicobacter pullorum TaxID=35818 RepID=UPI00174C05C3|nr:restriction endonuclease [Helicobacter pullorum]